MHKYLFIILGCLFTSFAHGADEPVMTAEDIFNATKTVCSGISDEIAQVAKISKINTAVTAAGTAVAGGALAVGIKKSAEEERIDEIISQMCSAGGCTPEGVAAMSDEEFWNKVVQPMGQIVELQKHIENSKKLGNWRTGLMAGTIGTNVASAIISGLNKDQSELVQHITACNNAVKTAQDTYKQIKNNTEVTQDIKIISKLDNVNTWCGNINTEDIEKIEKRMTGVMGTSIAGGVIGVVGTATSAAANADKYTEQTKRVRLNQKETETKNALNTTANVMAGANTATGLVETGLNISLIALTKRLIAQAERCEEIFK